GLNSNKLLCHQFCGADGDCKQAAPTGTPSMNVGKCLPVMGLSYSFCSLPCDPLKATTSCPSPLICVVGFNMANKQLTDCEDAKANMNGGDDADCTTALCMPGFTCVTETTGGANPMKRCRKYCAVVGDCSGIGPGGYKCCPNPGDFYGVCG